MLNFKCMKPSGKIISVVLAVTFFACALGATAYATSDKVIYHAEEWISPFENIEITEYDLGDGYTSTVTTNTVIEVTSVKHTDENEFSPEQWKEILDGIADGSILWED